MCVFAYLTSTLKVFLCACVQRMHVYMLMCMYMEEGNHHWVSSPIPLQCIVVVFLKIYLLYECFT